MRHDLKWIPSEDSTGLELLDAYGRLIAWVRPSVMPGSNTWAWCTWIDLDEGPHGQAVDELSARKDALVALGLWGQVSCALEPEVEFGQGSCVLCKLDRASKLVQGACFACEVDRACKDHRPCGCGPRESCLVCRHGSEPW